MTTSQRKISRAPRPEDLPHLPAGGRASLEALFYVASALAVIALVLGYGWFNLRPRSQSSEPLVVWKSEAPRLLQDAVRSGLRIEPGPQVEPRLSSEGIPCSQLGESWFRAMPEAPGARSGTTAPYPVACDWTPGAQEVIVITR